MSFLNACAIYPGVHYRDNTEYAMYRHAFDTCPRAQNASRRLLSLPLHLHLDRHDIERVASSIRRFYREAA